MNFKTRSLRVPLLALAILLVPSTAARAAAPHFATGGVSHVVGTTAQLQGTVNTEGQATSYFFEYGPNVTYGTKTKPVAVPIPNPLKPVKVGQSVTGLLPGYHYRIVGIYPGAPGPVPGTDKSFGGGKANKTKFNLPKGKEAQISTVYGGTAL